MFTDHKIMQYPVSDREYAINNLGGMVWLYDKHIAKFKDTYADSAIVIRNYLQNGKHEEARLLIHSVKGLSSTLGLHQLYYAASFLEQAIISSSPDASELLFTYDSCLTAVMLLSENS